MNKNKATLRRLHIDAGTRICSPALLSALDHEPGEDYLRTSPLARQFLRAIVAAVGKGKAAVFGYGSLMWDPGFRPVFAAPALVRGWRRSGCILSSVYRGTARQPGLVFGLQTGGSCRGMALGLPIRGRTAVVRYLLGREMFRGVYEPRMMRAVLADGSQVRCLGFVANRVAPEFITNLAPAVARRMVLVARGQRGSCLEYWQLSIAHLRALGIDWKPGFELG